MSLQGKSQIDRMHELMNSMNTSTVIKNPVVPKQKNAVDGKTYGIVKENSYYIIKEHNGRDYDYINGLKNKTDFKYNSYSEAMKQMNLMFGSLNEAYGYREGVDLFQEDKKKRYVIRVPKTRQQEQEEIGFDAALDQLTNKQDTGFVDPNPGVGSGDVPQGPPAPTTPRDNSRPKASGPTTPGTPPVTPPVTPPRAPAPTKPTPTGRPTLPTKPTPTKGAPTGGMDFDAEVSSIERELGGGEETPEKEIQSLTGKLGQALRQGEAEQVVDTELTKYVVNSVFSALNIGELTDEDKLEIIKKVKNAGTDEEIPGTPDMPGMGGKPSTAQIGMPGGHPEEEDDTEMEIDGLDSGMEDEELDLDIDDFEDESMEEDMLYGDGEESNGGITDLTQSLRDFVVKTVDSYIDTKQV